MLYHILFPLREIFSPLNVFGYITFRAGGAVLSALVISMLLTPYLIRLLKRRQIAQEIRTDGPATHLAKKGVPTMGGVSILGALVASTLLWARLDNRYILLLLLTVVWLGVLGFCDDYLKWVRKNSKGLAARYKLIGQIALAAVVAGILSWWPANDLYASSITVPYFKDLFLPLGAFYCVFLMVVVVGSSNAVNMTDGLDGLAVGNLVIAALPYAVLAYLAGNIKFSSYLRIIPVPGAGEVTIFLAAMIGAGLGFLWFNSHPAEIFMGDTGSLFLGGSIGVVAVIIKHELLLIVIGGVFVIEALSVIGQVASYKTRRKRILRMAPLHHHFELGGLPESKITVRFWIVGIILALVALASLKVR